MTIGFDQTERSRLKEVLRGRVQFTELGPLHQAAFKGVTKVAALLSSRPLIKDLGRFFGLLRLRRRELLAELPDRPPSQRLLELPAAVPLDVLVERRGELARLLNLQPTIQVRPRREKRAGAGMPRRRPCRCGGTPLGSPRAPSWCISDSLLDQVWSEFLSAVPRCQRERGIPDPRRGYAAKPVV